MVRERISPRRAGLVAGKCRTTAGIVAAFRRKAHDRLAIAQAEIEPLCADRRKRVAGLADERQTLAGHLRDRRTGQCKMLNRVLDLHGPEDRMQALLDHARQLFVFEVDSQIGERGVFDPYQRRAVAGQGHLGERPGPRVELGRNRAMRNRVCEIPSRSRSADNSSGALQCPPSRAWAKRAHPPRRSDRWQTSAHRRDRAAQDPIRRSSRRPVRIRSGASDEPRPACPEQHGDRCSEHCIQRRRARCRLPGIRRWAPETGDLYRRRAASSARVRPPPPDRR